MADNRNKHILSVVRIAVNDLVKVRTVASEIESKIQGILEGWFNPNDSPEFRTEVSSLTAVLVKSLLLASGYQAGNPPDISIQLPPEGHLLEADETAEKESTPPPEEEEACSDPCGPCAMNAQLPP